VRAAYLDAGGSATLLQNIGLTGWVGLDEYTPILDAALRVLGRDEILAISRKVMVRSVEQGRLAMVPLAGAPLEALQTSAPLYWQASFRNAGKLQVRAEDGEIRIEVLDPPPQLRSSRGWRTSLTGSILGVLDAMGAAGTVTVDDADERVVWTVTGRAPGSQPEASDAIASGAWTPPLAPPAPGDVLLGRYTLMQPIGQGGYGTVWRATDQRLGREVAIKRLTETVDRTAFGGLVREAEILGELRTPHIVRLFDLDVPADGHPLLVLELLKGIPVAAMAHEANSWRIVRFVASGALLGLAAAHEVGIVHGDVKPSNLFLTAYGSERLVKVLDFGLAGLVSENARGMTAGYFAPEARESRTLTAAMDVFALGVSLHRLATGRHPSRTPDPRRLIRAGLPTEAIEFIQRALAPDPAERFADARAMLDALQELPLAGEG